MSIDLEPCPFCGDRDSVTDIFTRDGRKIVCRCGASMIRFQPNASEKAAAAWNRRAPIRTVGERHVG
ncbi:Lar family restriction alleviation protein [Brevundimonas sp. NIBR11]|uniref:Lar family restriction alleviation protein n=1 Tax=Brevundimonas sp. NIBR11 TaxID=3015999 RepID=UPI0022F04175|nr:Lar family restriction alleviation protein [Brevundimonas sp. NIBR11]